MITTDTDRIEKAVELNASVDSVWHALTDPAAFSDWFGANLDGRFAPGRHVSGRMTGGAFERTRIEMDVQRIEPQRLLSFRWHPNAIDPEADYSDEQPTLVEFRLRRTPAGTLLRLTESGFDAIPPSRREQAYHANLEGWTEQLKNIEDHVARHP